MLLSFVKLGGDTASTFFECYAEDSTFHLLQQIIWIVLFVSFSVKTPLVPVHIWLPLAHSDANVSGSIILASIVLKLALYGFIRILIGILYLATARLTSFFLGYCSMSLVFSSFTTVRQFDLKVLVAYSSIAHMASSLLGTFSDTLYGLIGSVIFGLAHGFVSPGLFIIVGAVLYDRYGTRIINYFKGLSNILPFTALIFLILVFGNMGVPLTGNFIGEFMSLIGAYQQNIFIATIGTISVILSAIYSINTFNKTTSGSLSPYVLTVPDLFRKEYYTLLPLIVLTVILGIYPSFISSDIEFGLSSNLMLLPIICNNNMNSNNNNIESNEKNNYNSNCINSLSNSFVEDENNINYVTNLTNPDSDDIGDLPHDGIIPPHNSPIVPPVKPAPIFKPDSTKIPVNKPETQEGKGSDSKLEGSSPLTLDKSTSVQDNEIHINVNNNHLLSTETKNISEIDITNGNSYFIYTGEYYSTLIESFSYVGQIKIYLLIGFYINLIWQNKDLIKSYILNIYINSYSFVSRINNKIRRGSLIGLIVLRDDSITSWTMFDNILSSTLFHITLDLITMNVICFIIIIIIKGILEMTWIQNLNRLRKWILTNEIIRFIIRIFISCVIMLFLPVLPHLFLEIWDVYFYPNSLYHDIKEYLDSTVIRCEGSDDEDSRAPESEVSNRNDDNREEIIGERSIEDNNVRESEREYNRDQNDNGRIEIENIDNSRDPAALEREIRLEAERLASISHEKIEEIKEDLTEYHNNLASAGEAITKLQEYDPENLGQEGLAASRRVLECSQTVLQKRDVLDQKVNGLEEYFDKLSLIETSNSDTKNKIANALNNIADFVNGMYPDSSDDEGVQSEDDESIHNSATSESNKSSTMDHTDDNSDDWSDDN